jgi:hypothetical protein
VTASELPSSIVDMLHNAVDGSQLAEINTPEAQLYAQQHVLSYREWTLEPPDDPAPAPPTNTSALALSCLSSSSSSSSSPSSQHKSTIVRIRDNTPLPNRALDLARSFDDTTDSMLQNFAPAERQNTEAANELGDNNREEDTDIDEIRNNPMYQWWYQEPPTPSIDLPSDMGLPPQPPPALPTEDWQLPPLESMSLPNTTWATLKSTSTNAIPIATADTASTAKHSRAEPALRNSAPPSTIAPLQQRLGPPPEDVAPVPPPEDTAPVPPEDTAPVPPQ